MKSSKKRRSNSFIGKYKVLRLYCNIHNQGLTLFKIYGHKSFVWDFTQTEETVFPAGSVAYGGKLTEYRKDVEPHVTDYAYYPKDKHLYIYRSDMEEDGFVNV